MPLTSPQTGRKTRLRFPWAQWVETQNPSMGLKDVQALFDCEERIDKLEKSLVQMPRTVEVGKLLDDLGSLRADIIDMSRGDTIERLGEHCEQLRVLLAKAAKAGTLR